MSEKIIIVEDDGGVRFFLEEALKDEGYNTRAFESYEEASFEIGNDTGLIIMDIKLPGMDGLTAIEDIRKRADVPILIITAHGTKKNAMDAIRRGATDFFIKPIALDELKVMVKRVLGTRKLKRELDLSKEEELGQATFHGVVGKSEGMRTIFRNVEKFADKDITVLITGETGVGKEAIARLIHKLSKRGKEFVVVNCASIPDNLLESELFGYEKGAFTGAYQQKRGKFELAHAGTIVLDEIGEMSPYLQAKLLRVIEIKEIERLGDVKKRKVDVRIIATTNRDLEREMKEGGFREDLYYRLAQIHVIVPPLRERDEDVLLLVEHLLLDTSRETGRLITVADDARRVLLDYKWPGNVRELVNVIKRAAIMCDGDRITIDDLPLHLRSDHALTNATYSDKSLDEAISDLERKMIVDALKQTRGLQSKAAKLLGISERSIWYRIKKYNIDCT
ncbi:sigma-54-dependent transcriptional regulator [Syntrophorhabdus aromaticivorans]|jgi:DNA-binding NtrC family response regulator|uniref:Sigma-54-dependent Fis family transcriptional regulator n=1 Tax=Syntrophorhabdus aromaticivorans TaxID=328301 RepID=A0A971M6N7_9BACT|nr:sigma-54 dependent transcriptional regulator [Syntrophorhabdus aromaticivorans]NLW36324.1 sigma-54-dependent Fis family transcriptional regulator [Syntrophorhabdus aromaticivorans]